MPENTNKTRIPLGKDAKAYINSGTPQSPNWIEIEIIRDAALEITKGEDDVTTRGSGGWKEVLATLKEASIDFDAVWDKADSCYTILLRSMLFDEIIEMLFLDGPKDKEGSQGLRAAMQVFTFKRDEKLTNAIKMDVTVKPCYCRLDESEVPDGGDTKTKPSWVVVGADGELAEAE